MQRRQSRSSSARPSMANDDNLQRILVATRYKSFSMSLPIVEGGEPITEETAQMLKNTLFGDNGIRVPNEWLQARFEFNELSSNFPYGLCIPKNGTRPAMMCLQAYILKNLLFKNANSNRRRRKDNQAEFLKITNQQQFDALAGAITDLIGKAGGESRPVWLCLPSEEIYLEKSPNYTMDGLTERLQLFAFEELEEMPSFILKYLHLFQQESGLLLLMYSIILSRGVEKILEDLDGEQAQLIPGCGETMIPILTLMLTGRATPYLHNGTMNLSDRDHVSRPKTGIISRSEIGLLIWWSNKSLRKEVGSRMRTPLTPIWVTCIDDHYGVLFNPNRDLLRDHRAEHCFDLHYYNSSSTQTEPTVLNLDTRFTNAKEEYELPLMDRLIMTKWQEVVVNWNGTTPFV